MQVIDFSFNDLRNSLPTTNIVPPRSVTQILLGSNPRFASRTLSLPSWVKPSNEYSKVSRAQPFTCPILKSTLSAILELDASYYNYQLCGTAACITVIDMCRTIRHVCIWNVLCNMMCMQNVIAAHTYDRRCALPFPTRFRYLLHSTT